jgi:hypothetical protein
MEKQFEEEIKILQDLRQQETAYHVSHMQEEKDIWCDFVLYCHCNGKKGTDMDFYSWIAKNGIELPFWSLKWICETKFNYKYTYENNEWLITMTDGKVIKPQKSLKYGEIKR